MMTGSRQRLCSFIYTRTCSTISSNVNVVGSKIGGGIYNNAGVVTVSSSIIARNTAAGGGPDVFGAFTSGGYNLIGKTNGASGFANGVNRDQAGSIAAPLNPVLGPLADNDGPTFTHALLSGSPAIDKGKSFGLTIDQRGRPRSFDLAGIANATGGDGSDIGAFEVNPPLLRIGRSANNNVLVSWPASDTGFILQAKTSLNPSVDWSNIPGTPAIVANRFVVTESAASGNKFYRLKSP